MAGLLKFAAVCLLVSVCAEVITAQPACQQVDDQSLQYFNREVVFSRGEFKTWVPGTNCCTWNGVTCDVDGYVIALLIQNIAVNAPSPAGPGGYYVGTGLTTLSRLASMIFKNIAFNAGIPPAWGNLATLTVMSLNACNIDGTLPAELCQITGMTNFSMADNLLTGPLPACFQNPTTTFPQLKFFNISGNPVTSTG